MSRTKTVLLWLLGLLMVGVGSLHFIDPEPFARIVPPPLPATGTVYLSGVFEILGGVGILVPKTRRFAAWGLVALYVAVFPANIYMALNGIQLDPANPMPEWGAWLRLPFQALFIAWAFSFTRAEPATASAPPPSGS
jgi:uncharacterized membrane protein